jgi:20S proteasome alpha/beta subunit
MFQASLCTEPLIEEEFSGEEQILTFQIGLISAAGIVAASDRRSTYVTLAPPPKSVSTQTLEGTKFFQSDNKAVICLCAGGPFSQNIGRLIATECADLSQYGSELQWEVDLTRVARGVERPIQARSLDEVLVIRHDRFDAIWVVSKWTGNPAGVQKCTQHVCIGDNSHAQFLPRHLWNEQLSLKELERLALLTLAYAVDENPSTIGSGADVLTMERDKGTVWRVHSLDGLLGHFGPKLRGIWRE